MTADKSQLYRELAEQLGALLAGEPDRIANAANMAALLYHGLPNLNWAGFYFRHGGELVLGPFQGKPACVRIPLGKGVCGTAAAKAATVLVPDVHQFPGHIACDPVSRSELVVPLIEAREVSGVLDLDSPLLGRFDEIDQAGCEQLVALFVEHHIMHNVIPRLSATPGRLRLPAPDLGEHTAEVLGALGLDRAAIDELARDGIIGLAGGMP